MRALDAMAHDEASRAPTARTAVARVLKGAMDAMKTAPKDAETSELTDVLTAEATEASGPLALSAPIAQMRPASAKTH